MIFTQPDPFTNQSDVDEYINRDKIQCLICGKRYQFLPTHITRAHQTSADEYRQLFNINAGTPLAGLTYRQKQREKIERLQNEGRLTYEHLNRASEAARDADRNKTDYQRKQQSDLVRAVKPHTVNQLAPGSKRADGRDADHARLYQQRYRILKAIETTHVKMKEK